MLKEKNIATCVILTIVTCGIYGIVWFISMTDDVAYASQDRSMSGGTAFLYTILTCGIYSIYWSYKMGQLAYKAKNSRGMIGSDNSTLYLVLSILGLSIVSYCLIQSDINELANQK